MPHFMFPDFGASRSDFPQVPKDEDTFYLQIRQWWRSLFTDEWSMASPRRSSALREVWGNETLAKLRLLMNQLGARDSEYKDEEKHLVMRKIIRGSIVSSEYFGYTPQETVAGMEMMVRRHAPEMWELAEERWAYYLRLERGKIYKRNRGIVRLALLLHKARLRANDRLYRPGGRGYLVCKGRFELYQEKHLLGEK